MFRDEHLGDKWNTPRKALLYKWRYAEGERGVIRMRLKEGTYGTSA